MNILQLFVICFFSITLGYHFFLTFCTHEFIHTHTHGPHPRLLATLMTCFLLFDKLICDYIYHTAFCGRQFEYLIAAMEHKTNQERRPALKLKII